MMRAVLPDNETERLAALRALDVLDSEAEAEFDALVRAASLACGMPVSLVSLIDADRQWFKANVGLEGATETPRDVAFCAHAILGDDVFEVPDSRLDPRFADNPLVTGPADVRYYAGAPLRGADGHNIGTLCVIDHAPRQLTATQRAILANLAQAVSAALEGRRAARERQRAVDERQLSELRFRSLSESSPHGVFYADLNGDVSYTNGKWQQVFGLAAADSLGPAWRARVAPAQRTAVIAAWQAAVAYGDPFDMAFGLLHPDGTERVVHARAEPVYSPAAELIGYVGSSEDITLRRQQEEALRKSEYFLDRTGKLAGVGGWEVDLDSQTLFFSDETCRIHGLPPGSRPSLDAAFAFYAPEAQPLVRAAVERCLAGAGGFSIELPFIRVDGGRIWVRSVGTAEFVDGRAVRLAGAFQDVTERVVEREALQNVTERMRLAADSGAIGIWERDLSTDLVLWDDNTCALYGVAPQPGGRRVERSVWLGLVHPDDLATVAPLMTQALASGAPYVCTYRIVPGYGTVRHVRETGQVRRDADGRAIGLVGTNRDVSEAQRLQAELAEQHELLRVTLQSIGDAVITTDALGDIVWLNPVAERLTGWLNTEAKGRPLPQVFHIVDESTRALAENPVAACLATGQVVSLAHHTLLISRAGLEFGVEDSASPIRNEAQQVLGAVLVFHDVTEQRRLSGEMSYRATHDALTGLVNRAEFEARLRRLLQTAQGDGSKHALLFIDLDQFKLVNDACGHAVGDLLLQQVSKLLTDAVRTRDTLARIGGDEFAIILEKCTAEQAQRVAQQICDRMEDFRFVHDARRFRIGTSIGLVPVDARWVSTEAIVQAADTSCYAAKEAGRNRVHAWFDTDVAMRTRHGEMQWTTRIEHALDDDRFVLFGQRIVALAGPAGAPGGAPAKMHAEVLLRMLDEDGGLIPPGAFLPAAERFHLASRIDRWVVKRVIAWMKASAVLDQIENLSVNLSGQSVGDRVFHRWAVDQLVEAGPLICSKLCFEITETAAITNLTDAAQFIEQLSDAGVRVALDDFGAGASSFGYLKSMPVDYLKIDGQFVRDVTTDPLDEAAVRCFADVAKVVGMQTIAEFVDNEAVLQRLREIGIDYAQGYLMHKPAPLDALFAPVPATSA